MGLFDMFKSSGPEMTPHLALACSLIYMIAADGVVEPEEVGQLMSVIGSGQGKGLGGNTNSKALLETALKYTRGKGPDQFLTEAAPKLTDAQKMCILVNLCDSLLSDGEADPAEQSLFLKFLNAFGVDEARFKPYMEVIALKNDRSVFTKKDHPKNTSGYKVSLSKG